MPVEAPFARLSAVAHSKLGLVTRTDALRADVSDEQVAHLRRTGQLTTVFRGVHLLGANQPTDEQRAMAACLVCGPGAVASGRTAAAAWGLAEWPHDVELTLPATRRSERRGIVARRCRLARTDVTKKGPLPITTPSRTLLDLAGALAPHELELALDEAFRRKLVTGSLMRYVEAGRLSHAKGIATLRSLVQDRVGRGVPESVLESRALALIRRYRLPEPVRQYPATVRGRRVRFDLAYPEQRVAIELDGRAPHWGRDRWQADHDRDNAVELGGWRLLRFTWWDVTERPVDVSVKIAEALGLHPVRWRRARAR